MSTPPEKHVPVSDVAAFIEEWAPAASAQSYDNVGLQIGRPDRPVRRALIALDLTPAVVEQARADGVDLILTHHPLIFRPLRSLTPASLPSALALRLAESGIALISAHTNLDAARDGVSFALARTLGLSEVTLLEPMPETLFKLVTFVPTSHADAVREKLAEAGAGRIGEYDACAFVSEGTGYFRPSEAAKPFIGTPGGGTEHAAEVRIEVEVARWDLPRIVDALQGAHPYEQVAYDVYPVGQPSSRVGVGAVGALPAPEKLAAFLDRVCGALHAEAVRFAGDPESIVARVAVCGGSGGDLIGAARRAGADVFVTGDLSYHRFFDTMSEKGDIRMALVDAGHYETEAMTEELLVDRLSARFPQVSFQRFADKTSPIRWHAPGRPL